MDVMAVIDPKDLLTKEELATRLGVKPSWLTEKGRPRCTDPIPALFLGRVVRYRWSEVSAWMLEQREPSRRPRSAQAKRKAATKRKAAAVSAVA